jgi:hypothetical protein
MPLCSILEQEEAADAVVISELGKNCAHLSGVLTALGPAALRLGLLIAAPPTNRSPVQAQAGGSACRSILVSDRWVGAAGTVRLASATGC